VGTAATVFRRGSRGLQIVALTSDRLVLESGLRNQSGNKEFTWGSYVRVDGKESLLATIGEDL
jgi:hypothetical protein